MIRTAFLTVALTFVCGLAGCATTPATATRYPADKYGKTFYLDGAGNWGFGAASVPVGLQEAGYRGHVETFLWTTSFSPLVDQLNIVGAKLRSAALSDRIEQYHRDYPGNDLNMIALSAGTGVAIWAVEGLENGTKINNLVLLGSSLSHDYDARKALANMTGNIYVYHSEHDVVLGGVTMVGTIDGKRGVASAGLVGLDKPPGARDRVQNIRWSERYIDVGWTGAHTDCTSKPFIRKVIAKHVRTRRRVGRTAAAARYSIAPMLTSHPSR